MTSLQLSSLAVVMERPESLSLERLALTEPGDRDCIVDIQWSGISTGTERLLWTGRMPQFPGLGYPLVPGYESVGVVRHAGSASGRSVGDNVFVPGASCYRDARGLFGGASGRVVTAGSRLVTAPAIKGDVGALNTGSSAVLLALAATAYHVTSPAPMSPAPTSPALQTGANAPRRANPDLIVGHGVLGRLVARLAVAAGGAPVVWETNASRRENGRDTAGYTVIEPSTDGRRDYRTIVDCSGDASLLDALVQRLKPGGEIVLAGFYDEPVRFAFPPAFMREATFRISAEWKPADLAAVTQLVEAGALSLDGLVTHVKPAGEARSAYEIAFGDPACLKMVLDWRQLS